LRSENQAVRGGNSIVRASLTAQRLPDAKVIFYTDSGHGFLFQHADDFGEEVLRFLG
jgi:hypothetical protein